MHLDWRKTGIVAGFGSLALLMIGVAGVLWGGLIYANLRTGSGVPWSLPMMILVLWLTWQYLSGKGWPSRTAAARKRLLRANPVTAPAMMWSAVAGIFAIVALAGLWIVLACLMKMPPNPLLPGNFASSPILVASIIMGASLVAPIVEESSVRGYLQSRLEREFTPIAAVALSSIIFALAHVSQGLSVPKLVIYFLVGVTFGTLALLNDSILPVIPIHIVADLLFFVCIWPYDGKRKLVWQDGTDAWFWVHVAQVMTFTLLSLLAFKQLSRQQKGSHVLDRPEIPLDSGIHSQQYFQA
jgi:membrane protease YdiL (CAAX protease family)